MKFYRKVVVTVAKANPLKSGWKRSADKFIERLSRACDAPTPEGLVPSDVLTFLLSKARSSKTARDRNGTWYETVRDVIVDTMMSRKLVEFPSKPFIGQTFAQLTPNLTMGKDKAGKERYDKLCKKYSIEWAAKHVVVTRRIFPAYRVDTIVNDPAVKDGESSPSHYMVEQTVETEYCFIPGGTDLEKLQWTVAMGNRPTLELGPATKRASSGSKRNSHKKKA